MDPEACDYDAEATQDDGSCYIPRGPLRRDLGGLLGQLCSNDADGDEVCDEEEVAGMHQRDCGQL